MPTPDRHLWEIAERELTPKQLEAARLVWHQHLPSRDAALILHISHGALQDRLRTARKRLVDALDRKKAA